MVRFVAKIVAQGAMAFASAAVVLVVGGYQGVGGVGLASGNDVAGVVCVALVHLFAICR